MKKNFSYFILFILFGLMFVSNKTSAQEAKKYVLFEHFTNTGCGPCASQNPAFRAFYEKNTDRAHHIAFHPWWPSSSDPMYLYNVDENKEITQYYGVSGVPDMYANGRRIGSPVNANEGILSSAGNSPLKIIVDQETGEDSISASVSIKSFGELAAGNYIFRVAIVERLIHFNGAPNGEKEFPNVFRRFLTKKDKFTAAPVGEEVVYNYKFAIDKAKWDPSQIYVLAYVVNTKDKKVVNSGSSLDWLVDLVSESSIKGNEDVLNFNFSLDNFTSENQDFHLEIEGEYPDGWTYDLVYNNDIIQKLDTAFGIGRTPFKISVNTNGIGGVGYFKVSMISEDSTHILKSGFTAINNVESIVLTNNLPSESTVDIVKPYIDGLTAAESENFGYLGYETFSKAFEENLLGNMKNIFLSIGWFFPALNDDVTIKLEKFLDHGGNLMLTGQDAGWDILSGNSSANGTIIQKIFMGKYIRAKFIDDGSPASTKFKIEKDDPLYGEINGSAINKIYGSQYLYPDQIEPKDTLGHIFLRYTNNNKPGGYWMQKDNYKVVYMGIGPEQIAVKSVSDAIIKTTKDWFDGLISNVKYDQLMKNIVLRECRPNPVDQFAVISANNKGNDKMILELYDLSGKKVYEKLLEGGEHEIEINTSEMKNGIYFYSVTNGKGRITKKIIIQH